MKNSRFGVLSRGKTQVTLILLAAVLFLLGIFLVEGFWSSLLKSMAGFFLIVWLLFFVAWSKSVVTDLYGFSWKNSAEQSDFRRDLSLLNEQIGELNLRVSAPKRFQSQVSQAEKSDESVETVFSPWAFKAIDIKGKPQAQAAGRLAADQVMGADPGIHLRTLWNANETSRRRTVAMVGEGRVYEALKQHSSVELLAPGYALSEPLQNISYVVVDERALSCGPWAGVLTSAQTTLFLQLMKFLENQRQLGAVLIVIENAVQGHFNSSLRGLADINIKNGVSNLRWEDDVYLPVLNSCIEQSVEA